MAGAREARRHSGKHASARLGQTSLCASLRFFAPISADSNARLTPAQPGIFFDATKYEQHRLTSIVWNTAEHKAMLFVALLTMKSTQHRALKYIVLLSLVLTSSIVTILIVEVAYRYKINRDGVFLPTFKLMSSVREQYDGEYGVRYLPNSESTPILIQRGRVAWCAGPVSISNRDGLNGRTTIAKYSSADLKILAIGDSFTHLNQNGYTWPDLLQKRLGEDMNGDVAVLNYASGSYGVLQMFDLAAAMARQHKPDLVIVAFISDDITRSRWWFKEVSIGDVTRPLVSPLKDTFDLSVSSDSHLVHPSANQEWCRRNLGTQSPDDTLNDILNQYQTVKHTIYGKNSDKMLFSFTDMYFFKRLRYGQPLPGRGRVGIPRMDLVDFGNDERFVRDIQILKTTKVPLVLVHLPQSGTLKAGELDLNEQERALLNSLELLTGEQVTYLHEEATSAEVPDRIDLLPFDPHPNFAGLQMYAELVYRVLRSNRELGRISP